jgi:NH3-dependent NAD+ synthetase
VDWQERIDILTDLLDARRARRKPGQFHDCIIGVSGGKDSTRQALWVRDKFGINPLLVKSDSRIQQEQEAAAQAQQQQQLIQAGMGDPQKLGNAAMAAQQVLGPASPDQPQPEPQ